MTWLDYLGAVVLGMFLACFGASRIGDMPRIVFDFIFFSVIGVVLLVWWWLKP